MLSNRDVIFSKLFHKTFKTNSKHTTKTGKIDLCLTNSFELMNYTKIINKLLN